MTQIRIFLTDDHQLIRTGLASLLRQESDFKVVGEARDGHQTIQHIRSASPHLLITDVFMPNCSGLSLAKNMRERFPNIPVLVLSMHSEKRIISQMLAEGVRGYLLKEAPCEELFSAIRKVAKGGTWFQPNIREALFTPHTPTSFPPASEASIRLTEREQEILKLIAEERTQSEIGELLNISPHTVVYHKRKLLDKLDAKNTAGLIRKSIKHGLLH